MRPAYAGPSSGSSSWRATLDPGITSPNSNSAGYRAVGFDTNPASLTAANIPQPQPPPPQQQQFGIQEQKTQK
ncbi:unnamed protein product [Rotaria sordida]|uniref:Uncharacterized protein n=1 Tax=Rotaria sordida TaxID=392033 RepID=A0A815J173_9BILA|nr:unnamed protein product [Rotaria sordida]CAF1119229.1 unnamed protein product [Rotaria sordida]CAF1376186.1 unnamed protein product [Rotaria sordida]CAF3774839.1 unnamed protein product [Rotaria sordida]